MGDRMNQVEHDLGERVIRLCTQHSPQRLAGPAWDQYMTYIVHHQKDYSRVLYQRVTSAYHNKRALKPGAVIKQ